jgi:putative transposase
LAFALVHQYVDGTSPLPSGAERAGVSCQPRRFGYRRLALMLKRDGLRMNLKRVYRLRAQTRRPQACAGTRAPLTIPQSANQRWSIDFMHALDDGRYRILNVVE